MAGIYGSDPEDKFWARECDRHTDKQVTTVLQCPECNHKFELEDSVEFGNVDCPNCGEFVADVREMFQ